MLFFQSERPQWTLGHGAIAWDGQALSVEVSQTKRSFYLASEAPGGLLYRSRSTATGWGWLMGRLHGCRDYRIAADTSTVAYVVCKVRDAFAHFVECLVGSHLVLGQRVLGVVILAFILVAAGPLELIMQVGLCALLSHGTRLTLRNYPTWTEPYPVHALAVRNIVIGALSWLPSLAICSGIEAVLNGALRRLGAGVSVEQDVVDLMRQPGIGPIISLYAAIGAPILEEMFFRGVLYDCLIANEKVSTSKRLVDHIKLMIFGPAKKSSVFHWERMKTILKTSIIFGLCHGSIRQGTANIPIIAVTTFMGLILAILRELTGDLWASTTLHAVHNTVLTLRLHEIIPS